MPQASLEELKTLDMTNQSCDKYEQRTIGNHKYEQLIGCSNTACVVLSAGSTYLADEVRDCPMVKLS
jgi:hypothetical protein